MRHCVALLLSLLSVSTVSGANLTTPGDFTRPPLSSSSPPLATPSTSLQWRNCTFAARAADPKDFDCAAIDVPVCYADGASCSLGNTQTHSLGVLRRQTTKSVNAPTVWIVAESADDRKMADLMERIARQRGGATFNVYAMHTRLTTPPTDRFDRSPCGELAGEFGMRVDISSTMIDAASNCSRWMVNTFGINGINAYALDNAVRDLTVGLQLVQTQDELTNLYLLATGKTSWIVQRFMATKPSILHIAGYIFDTPHMMKRPTTYDAIVGQSTSRFLDGCESDALCRLKFANLSMSMGDVVQKIEATVDSATPPFSHCVGMLKNASFNEARDIQPSHGLRRFLAALRRDSVGIKYTAPLLYRVQRCISNDAIALTDMLKQIAAMPNPSSSSLAAFVDQVITFSEFWPTPIPSRGEMLPSLVASLVSDGAMVGQQPAFCLYTASADAACTALYKQTPAVNASLVLTYVPSKNGTSVNSSTELVGSATSDLLVLTSRLSAVGSASVASDLYHAFAARTAILIESDSVASSELEGTAVETLLAVVGRFVTKQAASLHGKWRLEDPVFAEDNLPPAVSTYASPRPVKVDFTLSSKELITLFMTSGGDAYENVKPNFSSRRTVSPPYTGDDDGIPYHYYGLLSGGFVLLFVSFVWAGMKKAREDSTAASPVHINVVMHPPAQPTQFHGYGYDYSIRFPPQSLPSGMPAVSAPTAQSPQRPLPSLALPRRWAAEPVNEYAYSYTPVVSPCPPQRTGP